MLGKSKIQKLWQFKPFFKLGAIFSNTVWLFADRILRMGASLIVGVWVARYLGVQQYGIFNYAFAFVALFGSFANLGLDSIVVRDIVRQPSNKEKILGTTFRLRLLGGLLTSFLAVASIFVFRHNDNLTLSLVSILSFAGTLQAFDTIDLWFQSQVKSKYVVIAKNAAFFITTLLKVLLIQIKAPLVAFAWVGLAESGLSAVGMIVAYKIAGYSLKHWGWNFSIAKNLLRESWSLILSGFTIMIYMKIDQIMLGEMIGDQAVGLYSAATRISEVWYFIPTAISSSLSPSIYVAKDESESSYSQKMSKLMRLMVAISIAIALPMSFLSGNIINILFGSSYAEAAEILKIHIWASLFVFMGVATSPWFVAEGLTHLSFRRTFMGAVTNCILNLLLIPKYGGVGAAVATVISQAFASFLSNFTHSKTRKLFYLQLKSLLLFKIV
jgi:polysaccharide transporter, PST family